MIEKKEYLKKINVLAELAKKYEVSEDVKENIDNIRMGINDYACKVLLVGRFSAGKSALLNGLLQRNILQEDQLPKTALAAELKYSDTEYCEFIKKDGTVDKCGIKEALKMNPDSYNHSVYYVNSDYLKRQQDIILVDMPGFDSSIERHNKAIMQYVAQACAYIIVVDCEDGTLNEQTINFMNEIKLYHSNLVIVITKCDKKTSDDIEKVQKYVKETADGIFFEDIPVISTSAFDKELDVKIPKLLGNINMQLIFEEKYKFMLNEIRNQVSLTIKSLKGNLFFDSTAIDRKIDQINQENSWLDQEFKLKSKSKHSALFEEKFPNVLEDVRKALVTNSHLLTNAAIAGKESFQRCVNEIIRPVLIVSVNKNIDTSFMEFINTIDFKISDAPDGEEMADDLKQVFNTFLDSYNGSSKDTKQLKSGKNTTDKGSVKRVNHEVNNFGGLQKILAAGAILTDYMAPWLEAVIVFLPDIINVLGEYWQKLQYEELNNKMQNEVIPQIMNRIEPDLKLIFKEIEDKMLDELKTKIEKLQNIKKQTLENLRNKSDSDKKLYETKLVDMDRDIDTIIKLI